jgi:hypothetical protein
VRSKNYNYFIELIGEPTWQQPVPPAIYERYEPIFPKSFLKIWKEEGFCQFDDGFFTAVNPDEWQTIADSWISGTKFEKFGKFFVVARSAFGKLNTFNDKIGFGLKIDPSMGTVRSAFMTELDAGDIERAGDTVFSFLALDDKGLDEKGKPVWKKARKKLGPMKSDEMYAFVPPFIAGGESFLGDLQKVNALEYCSTLRSLIDAPKVN